MSATGYADLHLPPGPERDEVMGLLRIGQKIADQWHGHRGFLQCYIDDIIKRISHVTFENVLAELEIEAVRRETRGEAASPIEKVDRVWQVLTYHHPRKGRQQSPFSTLRNKVTSAKKILLKSNSRLSLNRETGLIESPRHCELTQKKCEEMNHG